METGVKVGDAMTQSPISVTSSTTLAECAHIMKERNVGSVLVKEGKKLLGIVTERDVVSKAVAVHKSPGEMIVSEVMSPSVKTIAPDQDIFHALNFMRDHDLRHLPVVHGNNLVGLLTLKDVLKIEPQLFELMVEKIQLREEERKMGLLARGEASENHS